MSSSQATGGYAFTAYAYDIYMFLQLLLFLFNKDLKLPQEECVRIKHVRFLPTRFSSEKPISFCLRFKSLYLKYINVTCFSSSDALCWNFLIHCHCWCYSETVTWGRKKQHLSTNTKSTEVLNDEQITLKSHHKENEN